MRRSYSAACAASDRLSSDEMMCSASASASARLSCGLRISPTRQPGSSGNPSRRIEHPHAGPQSRFREDRHRQPRQHRRGHGAGVGAGVGDVVRPPDRLQAFDRGAPPAAARAPERQRQRLLQMGRVPVRRHPQQPLAAEHLRRARRAAVGDDRQIELVGVDVLDQLDRRLARHGQLDAGIGAREPRHDLRQIAVGVIVGQAEPHPAGQSLVVEGGERLDVELDDAARVIEQPVAILGELGGAAVAGEDRLAEPLLQPLHLHRHRRLGLVHDLGGLGEAAGLHDRDEGPKLVDVDQGAHFASQSGPEAPGDTSP